MNRAPAPSRHVAIVGAGPAGLMAAETLAAAGHRVTVYDRMAAPGRKFLMAGRGGLNLTHSEPLPGFLSRYHDASGRLVHIVERFSPRDLVTWAEGLGQETFVGSSGRVFPKAMKASPLLRAWLARLDRLGVRMRVKHRFLGFSRAGQLSFLDADGAAVEVGADAAVLALGGASWPRLGSDGAWAQVLKEAGIGVAELEPSNAGVFIGWSSPFVARHAGHPLKRIAITCGETRVRGEAMITRQGLEGGAVYALSAAVRSALKSCGRADLVVDLLPDLEHARLVERLAPPRGKQSMSNFLRKAASLSPAAIGLLREATPCLPADAATLARLIKAVPLTASGTGGLERAISTAGGVQWSEVDNRLMLVRRPGVFVAGEMIDWDAPTGGYLLQATFATAVAAARGVTEWLSESRPATAAPEIHPID